MSPLPPRFARATDYAQFRSGQRYSGSLQIVNRIGFPYNPMDNRLRTLRSNVPTPRSYLPPPTARSAGRRSFADGCRYRLSGGEAGGADRGAQIGHRGRRPPGRSTTSTSSPMCSGRARLTPGSASSGIAEPAARSRRSASPHRQDSCAETVTARCRSGSIRPFRVRRRPRRRRPRRPARPGRSADSAGIGGWTNVEPSSSICWRTRASNEVAVEALIRRLHVGLVEVGADRALGAGGGQRVAPAACGLTNSFWPLARSTSEAGAQRPCCCRSPHARRPPPARGRERAAGRFTGGSTTSPASPSRWGYAPRQVTTSAACCAAKWSASGSGSPRRQAERHARRRTCRRRRTHRPPAPAARPARSRCRRCAPSVTTTWSRLCRQAASGRTARRGRCALPTSTSARTPLSTRHVEAPGGDHQHRRARGPAAACAGRGR